MSIIKSVLGSRDEYHAALFVFPSESLQFEVLQFLRSQQISLEKNLRILPILFEMDKPSVEKDLVINVSFGILFGRLKPLKQPFKILHSDIKKILDIIHDIAPNGTKIADVTEPGLPVIQVHSNKLLHEVTYFGSKPDLNKFKVHLSQDKLFHERLENEPLVTEADLEETDEVECVKLCKV